MDTVQRENMFLSSAPGSIPNIIEIYKYLAKNGFFTAPASIKHHGNYAGALYDHSAEVARLLATFTSRIGIVWQRPESPFIIGTFHDLCKIDQYKLLPEQKTTVGDATIEIPPAFTWNEEQLIKGHGDKSVMLLASLMQLTEEEVMCIRYHMGAFSDKSQWDDYTRAVGKFPNILWTHQADMFAAQVTGV